MENSNQAKFELRASDFIVVSYGMGLDSTAILAEFKQRGMTPDLILFADTGGEKPATYAYLETINAWLDRADFPRVTVVKYEPKTAPYKTLEEKCLANEVLVSLVYNQHQCALVFKRDVQVKYLRSHPGVLAAIAAGRRIVNVIGYDDSAADRKRSTKANKLRAAVGVKIAERAAQGKGPLADQWQIANCINWYPLQDWGLKRCALAAIVTNAGLEVPVKSACFFCPASKPAEVVQLKNEHPDLFARAVEIERRAKNGKHAAKATLPGLGMGGWAWEWLADVTNPDDAISVLQARGVKIKEVARP